MFKATVITLFPEMFPGVLGHSLAGTALSNSSWSIEALDLRAFSTDKHRSVDDKPFGGGAGMVLRPDVVDRAVNASTDRPGPLVMMSPRGRLLDQAFVRELAAGDGIRILCGRFEGVDQRVLDRHQIQEVSIGDYVLSGGEPAALVLMDAIVRLLPGVMGNDLSGEHESHEGGLLEHPHYTRPADWGNQSVPDVLLSGHHGQIETWRRIQAEKLTQERRPDMWARHQRNMKD